MKKKAKDNLKKLIKSVRHCLSFNRLNAKIEKKLMSRLYKKKQKYIDKTLKEFKKKCPKASDETIKKLTEELIEQEERVYIIADKSLLRAGIKRAKIIFWVAAVFTIITTLVALAITIATNGVGVLLVPPLLALITPFYMWAITIATIHIPYNERIKGGLDAVMQPYIKEYIRQMNNDFSYEEQEKIIDEVNNSSRATEEKTSQSSSHCYASEEISSTKILLQKLIKEVDKINNKLKNICPSSDSSSDSDNEADEAGSMNDSLQTLTFHLNKKNLKSEQQSPEQIFNQHVLQSK